MLLLAPSLAWGGDIAHRLQIAPTGESVGDEFGYSVRTARDVNGDGFPDLIVGVPHNDASASAAGGRS